MVLDSGDLFFKSPVAPTHLEEQWRLQAEFIVDRFNDIGCEGVGIGENDFALGLGQLLKLKKRARFPLLNANIVNEKGEPLFDQHAIRKIGNLKVGIFSVLDPSLPLPEGLRALDAIEISRKIVTELRQENVDFIIALTHQGLQRDRNWAREVSGVDLVIGGHDSSNLAVPEKVIKKYWETLIVNGYELGKYTGVIDLAFRKGVHQFAASDDLSADAATSRYHNRIIPLDSAFSDGDPRLFKEVQKFKKRLQALAEKSVEPPAASKELARGHTLQFATYRKCMECHRAQFDVWKSSKHASAIIPLYIRNQHLNPECITCHSVGFREAGGFTDVKHPFVMPDGMKKAMEGFLQKLIET
ncbi:MAG: multiheme c-type cytochrome, partial [Deltaproteobacteria bacterium]